MSQQSEDQDRPAGTGVPEEQEMPPGSRVGPADPGDVDEAAKLRAEEEMEKPGGGH